MRCYRLPATVLPLLLITVPVHAAPAFNRIASFAIADNLPAELTTDTETSAEIIAATGDGNRLVYTDSVLGGIGIIDISEPRAPTAGGFIALEGDPTSLVVEQNLAWVAINTSMSYIETSGMLQVINVSSGATLAECDLGGQPDSVAVSSEQGFVAVAIENERDEELNEGELPQMPAGYLALLPVRDGLPDCAGILKVDLTGIATVGGDDPEPEFVDINDAADSTLADKAGSVIVSTDYELFSGPSARSTFIVTATPAEEVELTPRSFSGCPDLVNERIFAYGNEEFSLTPAFVDNAIDSQRRNYEDVITDLSYEVRMRTVLFNPAGFDVSQENDGRNYRFHFLSKHRRIDRTYRILQNDEKAGIIYDCNDIITQDMISEEIYFTGFDSVAMRLIGGDDNKITISSPLTVVPFLPSIGLNPHVYTVEWIPDEE
jgi:hypothetical protein